MNRKPVNPVVQRNAYNTLDNPGYIDEFIDVMEIKSSRLESNRRERARHNEDRARRRKDYDLDD